MIQDKARIRDIISNLDVIYECNPGHCMCVGEYAVEFHNEDHLITCLTFHHLESVRTEDRAENSPGFGNLELTAEARKYFSALFASIPELTPKVVLNKMIEEDSSSW